MGCVWPGKVHFPDFNHPKAFGMWQEGLCKLYYSIKLYYHIIN